MSPPEAIIIHAYRHVYGHAYRHAFVHAPRSVGKLSPRAVILRAGTSIAAQWARRLRCRCRAGIEHVSGGCWAGRHAGRGSASTWARSCHLSTALYGHADGRTPAGWPAGHADGRHAEGLAPRGMPMAGRRGARQIGRLSRRRLDIRQPSFLTRHRSLGALCRHAPRCREKRKKTRSARSCASS